MMVGPTKKKTNGRTRKKIMLSIVTKKAVRVGGGKINEGERKLLLGAGGGIKRMRGRMETLKNFRGKKKM